MFISTKVLVVISFFASSFAEPLAKRAYIPELKASLARIDDSWKKVENQINALPRNATASDFQAAKSAMDSLTSYIGGEYQTVIRQNGPFTNTKWSDEFVNDMKPYQATGANAMRTLKTYVSRINGDSRYSFRSPLYEKFTFLSLATGGVPLLKEFHSSTGETKSAHFFA
ncbi:hypothetical protein MD484_g1565, partial [Candolleomyces efflorescens]